MIFDYCHIDMNHMMDWGLNGWNYIILGGVLLLIVTIFLLFILSRSHRQDGFNKAIHYETYNNDEDSRMQINNYQRSTSSKEHVDPVFYCPNCGEKLDGRTLKYCPFCGSKI